MAGGRRFDGLGHRVFEALYDNRVTLLQATLGLVFIWFGALKVIGKTPVEDLVASTLPLVPDPIPTGVAVVLIGLWELVIGALLLWGRFVRTMLALFLAQMAGTFSILVAQPGLAFQGYNPFLLTVEGEFVVKNLVLVAAGLSIGAHLMAKEREANEPTR